VSKDWREVSEAASHEQDPKKLLELVEQLDKLLEECENEMKDKQESLPRPRQSSRVPSFRNLHSFFLA
jgi:hypothetical protein